MGGKTRLIIPAGFRGRGYGRQNQVDYTRWSSRARVWEAKSSQLYPLDFACEGIGDKIKPIIPTGLRMRGYGRQNQADYTRWTSRARVWETKSSRLYPLVFASEGIGDKTKSIIPAGLRMRGYRRQNQVDYTRWTSRARVW